MMELYLQGLKLIRPARDLMLLAQVMLQPQMVELQAIPTEVT
jgi:hypothetical protein